MTKTKMELREEYIKTSFNHCRSSEEVEAILKTLPKDLGDWGLDEEPDHSHFQNFSNRVMFVMCGYEDGDTCDAIPVLSLKDYKIIPDEFQLVLNEFRTTGTVQQYGYFFKYTYKFLSDTVAWARWFNNPENPFYHWAKEVIKEFTAMIDLMVTLNL